MMWLIWVDQARDESRWTPRSLTHSWPCSKNGTC